jgi:hypothetical protein
MAVKLGTALRILHLNRGTSWGTQGRRIFWELNELLANGRPPDRTPATCLYLRTVCNVQWACHRPNCVVLLCVNGMVLTISWHQQQRKLPHWTRVWVFYPGKFSGYRSRSPHLPFGMVLTISWHQQQRKLPHWTRVWVFYPGKFSGYRSRSPHLSFGWTGGHLLLVPLFSVISKFLLVERKKPKWGAFHFWRACSRCDSMVWKPFLQQTLRRLTGETLNTSTRALSGALSGPDGAALRENRVVLL